MHSLTATPSVPTDEEFSTAWLLFQAVHDDPSVAAVEELLVWLRSQPRRVRALDEALTLWGLSGAAMLAGRRERREASPDPGLDAAPSLQ